MRGKSTPKKKLESQALSFITHGIACNCLVLLKSMGIFEFLLKGHSVDKEMLVDSSFCSHYTAAYSALVTLEKAKVVERNFDKFSLTEMGYALGDYTGLITMLFEGYGSLIANQVSIVKKTCELPLELLDGKAIAESSIEFGNNTIDPLISNLFKRLRVKGTICDLGCGIGSRLSWLCKEASCSGLGFDNDDKTIDLAQEKFRGKQEQIAIEKGDITQLEGIWEDVTVLMQYFVFHDFAKSPEWFSIMNGYLTHFPHIQYFLYVDIVAPSEGEDIMPGYDYVHGLLGIQTPNYEEMHNLFEKSRYKVVEELAIPHLPNTFLWILKPTKL